MIELSNNIYAAFGVFGFIIIGMGLIIKYLLDEKKTDSKSHKEFMDKVGDAIIELNVIVKHLYNERK